MSISEQHPRFTLARELALAFVAGTCLALVASSSNPALPSLEVHPVWVISLIVVARRGAWGLASITVLAGSVLVAEWLAGGTGVASLARASTGGDLLAVSGLVVVATIVAANTRRKAALAERLELAEQRTHEAEIEISALIDTAATLRDRCDRSAAFLAFVTDVALQLDDDDPTMAGQAALELAIVRTGARGGSIQLVDRGNRLRTLTSRGIWSAEAVRPPVVFRDLTVAAAITHGRPVAAHEVPGVRPEDSDLAAPLLNHSGHVLGVICLRGVPYSSMAASASDDLGAVARWATGRLAPRRFTSRPSTAGVSHVAG